MKKNIFKTVTIILTIGIVFTIGFIVGEKNHKEINNNKVEIKEVLTESTDEIKLDKGETYKQYTDGSWSIENDKTNTFVFQPVSLGDYDIECKSKEEFNNLVQTYLNMQNEGTF